MYYKLQKTYGTAQHKNSKYQQNTDLKEIILNNILLLLPVEVLELFSNTLMSRIFVVYTANYKVYL